MADRLRRVQVESYIVSALVIIILLANLWLTYQASTGIDKAARAIICVDLAEENPAVGPAGATKACGLE